MLIQVIAKWRPVEADAAKLASQYGQDVPKQKQEHDTATGIKVKCFAQKEANSALYQWASAMQRSLPTANDGRGVVCLCLAVRQILSFLDFCDGDRRYQEERQDCAVATQHFADNNKNNNTYTYNQHKKG